MKKSCLSVALVSVVVVFSTSNARSAEDASIDNAAELTVVECDGTYKQHLQGVCIDADSIYWCFTSQLVKTDARGKILKQLSVNSHHGDLCVHDGRVYVAVNFGKFNRPEGAADSWIYVYRGEDLTFIEKHAAPQLVHGAGGMAYHDDKFFVVGGLPPGVEENCVFEYDVRFHFLRKHILKSGYTLMGIQTATYADGQWWFGCYGSPRVLLRTDERFERVERFEFDASLGLVPLGAGKFLVARGASSSAGHTGRLVPAEVDATRGLVVATDAD